GQQAPVAGLCVVAQAARRGIRPRRRRRGHSRRGRCFGGPRLARRLCGAGGDRLTGGEGDHGGGPGGIAGRAGRPAGGTPPRDVTRALTERAVCYRHRVPPLRALVLAPFDEAALARLRRIADVTYESWLEAQRLHAPDELGARLHDGGYNVLVVEADFVFEEVFEAAPGLRFVGICRNALTQADLEAASERGIPVVHTPGRNTNAVAELTVALMLALARGIVRAHTLVAGAGWRDPALGYRALRGREVAGATVSVVGFGQIGRAVTTKALALGASVLAYDPLVPSRDIEALGARAATLDHLLAHADFVSLHV